MGECQAETVLHLVLPLFKYRGRTCYDDPVDAVAQQQFARDEAGLDGLAEPDVVCDEQVDARQPEGLAQRVELVGVYANARAKRRLKEIRVGCRDAVPRQRAEIGSEQSRIVEALVGDRGPAIVSEHADVGSCSHKTESGSPCASSSRQDRSTRVASSGEGGSVTFSTRYRR